MKMAAASMAVLYLGPDPARFSLAPDLWAGLGEHVIAACRLVLHP